MFGTLGRRLTEGLVGLFALLGFCFVPLGSRTGLEHTLSFIGTPSVREAGAGLWSKVLRVRSLIAEKVLPDPPEPEAAEAEPRPEVPVLPHPKP